MRLINNYFSCHRNYYCICLIVSFISLFAWSSNAEPTNSCQEQFKKIVHAHHELESNQELQSMVVLQEANVPQLSGAAAAGAAAGAYFGQLSAQQPPPSARQLHQRYLLTEHNTLMSIVNLREKLEGFGLKNYQISMFDPIYTMKNKKIIESKINRKLTPAEVDSIWKGYDELDKRLGLEHKAKLNFERRGDNSRHNEALRFSEEQRTRMSDAYDKHVKSLNFNRISRATAGAGSGAIIGAGLPIAGYYFNCKKSNMGELLNYFEGSFKQGCRLIPGEAQKLAQKDPNEISRICREKPEVISMLTDSYKKLHDDLKGSLKVQSVSEPFCQESSNEYTVKMADGTEMVFVSNNEDTLKTEVEFKLSPRKSVTMSFVQRPSGPQLYSTNGLDAYGKPILATDLKKFFLSKVEPPPEGLGRNNYYGGAAVMLNSALSLNMAEYCLNKFKKLSSSTVNNGPGIAGATSPRE